MLDHLVEVVREREPDVVIVAGDVFDRAYPPLGAIEQYDDTISRLAAIGRPVVITSGNHDSAVRLGLHARVAERAGVHVRTRADRIGEAIEVTAADGSLALIYAIPYLDPPSCAPTVGATEPTHAGVLAAALRTIDADRANHGAHLAIVAAHGVVSGGRAIEGERCTSSAERSIDVGGVSAVPASLFAGIDYVALGHLHHPQSIGDRIRYSGAPLAFGFDEAGDRKSLSLVELVEGEAPRIETIPTPVPRAIVRIRGTLEALLAGDEHASAQDAWVEATLTDRLRPKLAMEQLRRRFPHVLKIEHRPEGRELGEGSGVAYRERVQGRSESQIAARFLAEVRGGIDADDEEQTLLAQALEAYSREEALR